MGTALTVLDLVDGPYFGCRAGWDLLGSPSPTHSHTPTRMGETPASCSPTYPTVSRAGVYCYGEFKVLSNTDFLLKLLFLGEKNVIQWVSIHEKTHSYTNWIRYPVKQYNTVAVGIGSIFFTHHYVKGSIVFLGSFFLKYFLVLLPWIYLLQWCPLGL